jgi:DNA-binding CsgD family transcriptional regulator
VGTVKTHVRAIMFKLGSTSRMAAILEGNRRGRITIR